MATGRRGRGLATLVVIALGLTITLGLAVAAATAHNDNEDRLLRQRAQEVTAILTVAIPGIQAPLATTASLVDQVPDVDLFDRVMGAQVGAGKPFVSAALLPVDGGAPLTVVGAQPLLLDRSAADIREFVERAATTKGMSVADLDDAKDPRIGYGYPTPGDQADYVVYAETSVPADRRASPQQNTAFSNIDYAIYLDTVESPRRLLVASTEAVPFEGRKDAEDTPLGDARLQIVVSPNEDLGGALLASLPWLVVLAGVAMTAGAALLTARLQHRRGEAEGLASAVTELYGEQRAASMTLQQSLLPRQLPSIDGVEVTVRYSPGVAGTEVGGDWYEVLDLGSRTVLVVGDVSGRGLGAASVMAAVRHSVRAFASQGDSPAAILRKANEAGVIDLAEHFATVLCAVLDRERGTLEVATAGHPAPVVVDDGGARFLEVPVGRPIGAPDGPVYEIHTTPVEPGTTVMLFTDGLFERRGEALDIGLERVRLAADRSTGLDDLVNGVFEALGAGTNQDDAAILAVRWTA